MTCRLLTLSKSPILLVRAPMVFQCGLLLALVVGNLAFYLITIARLLTNLVPSVRLPGWAWAGHWRQVRSPVICMAVITILMMTLSLFQSMASVVRCFLSLTVQVAP